MKGVKKDEQYRLLWNELETVISTAGKSSGHKQLLTCIRECRARNPLDTASGATAAAVVVKEIIDVDDPTPSSSAALRASVIRATTDSPLSPTSGIDVRSKRTFSASSGGNRSLLDIFLAAERVQNTKRLDFSGRLCTPPGQIAKLYPNLLTKEAAAAAAAAGGKDVEALKLGA